MLRVFAENRQELLNTLFPHSKIFFEIVKESRQTSSVVIFFTEQPLVLRAY